MENERVVINRELSCLFCEVLEEPHDWLENWCRYCDRIMPIIRIL